jgi:hypothetical protein
MNWNERYAAKPKRTPEETLNRIQQLGEYDHRIKAYNDATGHQDKANVCYENMNNRRDNARRFDKNSFDYRINQGIASLWNTLRTHHSDAAIAMQPKEEPKPEEPTLFNAGPRALTEKQKEKMRQQPHYLGGEDNNGWMPGTTGPKID